MATARTRGESWALPGYFGAGGVGDGLARAFTDLADVLGVATGEEGENQRGERVLEWTVKHEGVSFGYEAMCVPT